MKKVIVISTSLRVGSNSDMLADKFIEGAQAAGNIRVSPAGVRALRNTGDDDMVMMCIQYEAKPISSFMDDANIIPIEK